MKYWGVMHCEPYAPVVNGITVTSLLDIASLHDLPRISIIFVLAFPQADLDVEVFMELPLGIGVDENRGEQVLKLN